MAKKTVHHLDFDALVHVNEAVVALSSEAHSYSESDGKKMSALVKEVEGRADNAAPDEAIPDKAALLMFKVASGQYFHAGNKRTSLVSGAAFLAKNGYSLKLNDLALVDVVDRAGMGAATLDDVYAAVRGLLTKGKADRKGWEGVVDSLISQNQDFLTGLAAK
ncbi:MAG: hypothetical protein JRM73_01455 [Nitrososphaerota archaeon]|nr:hypothetical protein [Nitrososphaerota archaeon]